MELAVGGALVALAREVESTWYGYVGAQQVEAMRAAVADAASREAALAKRFFETGNVTLSGRASDLLSNARIQDAYLGE